MDEIKIKKAAELLLKGATMLHIACPDCSEPIYKLKNNNMKCISCNKQVIFENEEEEKLLIQDKPSQLETKDPIKMKIDQLGKQLLKETKHDKIIKLAELIANLKQLIL